jgi:hypothetical protein
MTYNEIYQNLFFWVFFLLQKISMSKKINIIIFTGSVKQCGTQIRIKRITFIFEKPYNWCIYRVGYLMVLNQLFENWFLCIADGYYPISFHNLLQVPSF